jgi:DNA-binding transcriptional regulator YdaS (Cro superfamily)
MTASSADRSVGIGGSKVVGARRVPLLSERHAACAYYFIGKATRKTVRPAVPPPGQRRGVGVGRLLRHRQPKTDPLGLSGHERFEQLRRHVRRRPRAGVRDFDHRA